LWSKACYALEKEILKFEPRTQLVGAQRREGYPTSEDDDKRDRYKILFNQFSEVELGETGSTEWRDEKC
jgi:hypothetical protein